MNVEATAILVTVVFLFVDLNMNQSHPLSGWVNCSRFAVRSALVTCCNAHTTPPTGRRLQVFLDQLSELVEKVGGVMRPGRSFRMILHTEGWQLLVTHSFDCAVVQVDVAHFNL